MRKYSPGILIVLLLGFADIIAQKLDQAEIIIRTSKAVDHKTNYSTFFGISEHIDPDVQPISLDARTFLLSFDSEMHQSESIIRKLRKNKNVFAVQSNTKIELRSDTDPNDNLRHDQWYLDIVKAAEAWNLSVGGTNALGDTIVIAVIDNGFDLEHEDLSENIWVNASEIPNDNIDNDANGFVDDVHGWDFSKASRIHPKKNHGTSVLGLIGAKGNNTKGIAGINWKVKLMPISIDTRLSSLISAFDYVRHMRQLYNESGGKKGAFIVAASYSGGKNFQFAKDHPIWCGMYDAMGEVGVLNVGATTNINADVDIYGDMPSTCPSDYLIMVTSTDEIDSKLLSAGFGATSVDLGAPGINLLTTHVDNIYHHFSGTSAATPLVAGTIGLLYSIPNRKIGQESLHNPGQIAKNIKSYILNGAASVSDLDERTTTGGRLDLANAIRELSKANGGIKQGLQFVQTYPNPAIESINLTIHLDDLQEVRWDVVDILGRTIWKHSAIPTDFPIHKQQIETSNWPVGTYVVQVRQGNFNRSKKFSVIR